MHDRRESNLQEYIPDIDEHEVYGEEEMIREENNHPEVYEQMEHEPTPVVDQHQPELQPLQPHQNNEPRQTHIESRLEYENVRVSFPISTDTGINSYMIYKVKYTWKGTDFVINRRFSDFTSLRDSLRKFLPCHYIFPVHKKKTIVS